MSSTEARTGRGKKKFHPVITGDESCPCSLHVRFRRKNIQSMGARAEQASTGAVWFPERPGNRAPCSWGSPAAGEPHPRPSFLLACLVLPSDFVAVRNTQGDFRFKRSLAINSLEKSENRGERVVLEEVQRKRWEGRLQPSQETTAGTSHLQLGTWRGIKELARDKTEAQLPFEA